MGLVPGAGTPVEIAFDTSDIPFCHRPASDASGTGVAIGVGLHHLGFSVYPINGGSAVGMMRVDHQDTGPIYDAIVPTAVGFHAAEGTGVESVADRGVFTAYDAVGTVLATSPLHVSVPDGTPTGTAGLLGDVRLLKRDPFGGGSVLLTTSGPLMTPTTRLEITDGRGHRTAGAVLDKGGDLAVATDGHIVVVAPGFTGTGAGGSEARWFDHEARPLTDWFALPSTLTLQPFSRVVLQPLADGSIGFRDADTWTLVLPNGAARTEPPPAWLAARPRTEVWVVKGGRANAVVGAPSAAYWGGGSSFEIVTPSGRSCGTVTLPAGAGEAQVDFGADGTAFVFSVAYASAGGSQRCTFRWWPGLVR